MLENQNNPDPDRLEPWLEAYAQNRRKELDEPIELDEATRTMLQGEVERVYPKQQAEAPAPVESGMPAWLPWVMGGAVCALAIVVSLDLNSGLKAKQMELAAADPVTEESGKDSKAPIENVRNEMPEVVASNADKERSISRSSDGGVRDLSNLKDLRPEAVPAPSLLSTTVAPAPTAIEKRNLLVQPSVKPPSSRMRGGGLGTPRRANSPAPAPRAIRSVAPAPRALTARSAPPMQRGRGAQPEPTYYSNLSQLRQTFRQASVISDASSERRQKAIPQPVLVNFQVERSGNLVKILDQDGSVYTGNVINEEKYANARSGIDPAKAELKQQKGQTPSQRGIRPSAAVSPDQGQFYFRVQGNNRTLQQMVVIEATLDGMPAENGKLGSNRGFSAPPKLASSIPLPGTGPSADKKEVEELAKVAGKKADDRVALSVPQLRLLGNTRIGKANYRLDAYQTPSGSYRPAVKTKAAAPAPKKK